MVDREKVIKAVQDGLDFFEDRAHGSRFEAWIQAQKDALALLKAQEKRVIKNSAGNGICPGCGHIVPAWSSPNYCGYCGQAVKWE